jgi:hypothetical protein
MVSTLFYYQLALLALLWLFVMLPLTWPRRSKTPPPVPATPIKPKRKRSPEPKAFSRQDKLGVSCRVKVPVG